VDAAGEFAQLLDRRGELVGDPADLVGLGNQIWALTGAVPGVLTGVEMIAW